MGGRVAERIILGTDGITTGASSDLQHVAELAREMVAEEGMGGKLRDQVFNTNEVNFFQKKPTLAPRRCLRPIANTLMR